MKNKFWLILAIFIALVFLGCTGSGGSSSGEVKFDKDASYALGLLNGSSLRNGVEKEGLALEIDEFLKGMKDGISGNNPRFDLQRAEEMFEEAYTALKNKRNETAMQEEISFLAENSKKPGIIVTESGLQYEVIAEGAGPKPTETDRVRIHFDARLLNGNVFDSSYDRGEPQVNRVNQAFPGWAEGMMLMSAGSKYKLYIPSALAFGDQGYNDPWGQMFVPPYAVLIFEIELLEINPAGE